MTSKSIHRKLDKEIHLFTDAYFVSFEGVVKEGGRRLKTLSVISTHTAIPLDEIGERFLGVVKGEASSYAVIDHLNVRGFVGDVVALLLLTVY